MKVYRVRILILQRVSVKTQVSRVLGEDSTTEPAIRLHIPSCFHLVGSRAVFSWHVMRRDVNTAVSANTHPTDGVTVTMYKL